jgi:hypothetical protein
MKQQTFSEFDGVFATADITETFKVVGFLSGTRERWKRAARKEPQPANQKMI